MVLTVPLSRIPEMAAILVTMFDPEMTGTHQEPPPKRVIISNVLDHLSYEGLMTWLSERTRATNTYSSTEDSNFERSYQSGKSYRENSMHIE